MWDIAIFIINKIKEAIESVKTYLEEIKTNTAGNTTASASGTLSQKLTHIIELLTVGSVKDNFETIMNTISTGEVPIVKSVQSGTTTLSNERNISINEVNPDKCLYILRENNYTNITLTSTTLSFSIPGNITTTQYVHWQVIEFY